MNRQEYKDKIKELETKLKEDKISLALQFCRENKKFNKGDIIENSIGRIKIDKITADTSGNDIEVVYSGVIINKDGTFSKKGVRHSIWENSIKDFKINS